MESGASRRNADMPAKVAFGLGAEQVDAVDQGVAHVVSPAVSWTRSSIRRITASRSAIVCCR